MSFLNSTSVKMFPTSKRSSVLDINAKMPTEHNLISIVNRITGKHAFVIDGLTISSAGTYGTLQAGSCNIHGYIFHIIQDTLIDIEGDEVNNILAFQIKVKNLDGNESIVAFDTTNILDGDNKFKGLSLVKVAATTPAIDIDGNITTYTLFLGEWYYDEELEVNLWHTLYSKDGVGGNRPNTLTQWANNIAIHGNPTDINEFNQEEQDLETFLRDNMGIDDGEVVF